MIYPEEIPHVSSGQVLYTMRKLVDAYTDAALCVADFTSGIIEKAIYTQHRLTMELGNTIIPKVWFDK